MENILKLKENGSTLSLRTLAKSISLSLKDYIENNENVILDFDKVDRISSSFADELIAKVMIEVGKDKFINLVKIRNTNKFVKSMIDFSIRDRLQLEKSK